MADWLLSRAIGQGASDLLLEPSERGLIVRLRIDGMLQEIQRLPPVATQQLTNRLRIMAGLSPGRARAPQQGRIRWRDREIPLAVPPAPNGDRLVLLGGTPDDGAPSHLVAMLNALTERGREVYWIKPIAGIAPPGITLVSGSLRRHNNPLANDLQALLADSLDLQQLVDTTIRPPRNDPVRAYLADLWDPR